MLTPVQRKKLKAEAHHLEPVVTIGGKGLTQEVIAEVERALTAHQLIKVRAPAMDRHARADAHAAICEKVGAEPVQHIGKVLVLYRKKDGSTKEV